jgi:FAD/FMN-containing dehydrogenase
VAGLGDETSVWAVLRKAPPLPFLPEAVHGREVIVFAVFHAGDPEAGRRAIAPVRGFGRALGEHIDVHARWEEPSDDGPCITWARTFFQESAPYATGGVYVNFLTQEEMERVRAAYGRNYDRLLALKRKFDPNNLFRLNQNIRP